MKNVKKTLTTRLVFVVFTSIVFFVTYFISSSMDNDFQTYAFSHHFNPREFPHMNVIALRISIFLMALCALKKFQSLKIQRSFMLVLMLCLIIGLSMPISLDTYPYITGVSRIIFSLTEPWRQLYVPPAFRATIEGATEGLCGIFDLSSVALEYSWSRNLGRYHYFILLIVILFIVFWQLARTLEYSETRRINQTPDSIWALIKLHPYIFIVCFFGGFSEGIFDYTFLLSKEVLPDFSPRAYQYTLYLGGILGPILIGRLADKKGIFFMTVVTGFLVTLCKFVSSLLCLIHTPVLNAYYVVAFIEGGLAASIWMLSVAIVGERLRNKGIFRAFAISNVAFGIGSTVAGSVYTLFADSFLKTKLGIGCIDLMIMGLIWHYHKNDRPVEKNI